MNLCLHTAGLAFQSATASGGNDTGPNCVEVAPFRKATRSNPSGNCVEVGFTSATKSNGNGGANCVEVGPARAAAGSAAAGHCVTVAPATATASVGNSHCVEPGVAAADSASDCTPETCKTPGIQPGDVVVRDSKLGEESPLVVFRGEEWRGFVAGVVAGRREIQPDAMYVIRDPRTSVVLRYTAAEWDAFLDGCVKGEFTYDPPNVAVAA